MTGGRITVLGIAPGQTSFDQWERAEIETADLLVGAQRHLEMAGGFKGETMPVEHSVSAAVERVVSDRQLKAVFLASGDPGFFGIGALLLKKLPKGEVCLKPKITSLQAAFGKLGLPWSDARLISLHGRSFEALDAVLGASTVGILTDASNGPARIARHLAETGFDGYEMAVAADVGMPAETIETGSPGSFLDWNGSTLNVVILSGLKDDPRPLGPGLPDEGFLHPRGRITKDIVRAAALSRLALPRKGVLWDIGAGSGSVGIEAALLSPLLRVYCVEKDEEAHGHAVENRRNFRAANVTVLKGEAPGALSRLPDPDRVFIGGSGGLLGGVLDEAFKRLKPGGLAVVSTVLAETFHETLNWSKEAGYETEWCEIQVSRSKPTGQGTRLKASDPVTLVTIFKGREPK